MEFPHQTVPRWIIFLIDTSISMFALFAAYMLRFEFTLPQAEVGPLVFAFPIYMVVRILSFLVGKTYAGIIRYSGTEDSVRILKIIWGGAFVFVLFNFAKFYLWDTAYFLPFSIIIIDGIIASALLIVFRLGVKLIYLEIKNPKSRKAEVIIYGAGEAGMIAKQTLDRDVATHYKVIGFLDDDKKKVGKRLEGVTIYHSTELKNLLRSNNIEQVIIAIQNPEPRNRRLVIETATNHRVKSYTVPPANDWIRGELSFKQIKEVRIEDLLGRDSIQLKQEAVERQLNGKRILVTGAAGSIGSGLLREIAKYQPGVLIALDQAESPLYEIELELNRNYPKLNLEAIIGDIRRNKRMRKLFEEFRPEIVFHAAAYKHVPLMELNPSEAVLTNVSGTKNIVDLSILYKVEAFVLISTDKAVNPTSVMGGTKRVAEIYAQSQSNATTKIVTTRFGNVLGSNGSVIPLFKKQIDAGGPLTVTHEEVTRYFMTIPEACQLVLEAGAMGQGGEIFVFDMGESVKIIDLAKQMIRLSGLEEGRDIEIEIVGLRPGEKLYEELLNAQENTLATHHPRIKRAKIRAYGKIEAEHQVSELINLFSKQDNDTLVRKIKEIVPEFKSKNSEFSKFDV